MSKLENSTNLFKASRTLESFFKSTKEANNKMPVYKGCPNNTCFCTGHCREIVGWRDKDPNGMNINNTQ